MVRGRGSPTGWSLPSDGEDGPSVHERPRLSQDVGWGSLREAGAAAWSRGDDKAQRPTVALGGQVECMDEVEDMERLRGQGTGHLYIDVEIAGNDQRRGGRERRRLGAGVPASRGTCQPGDSQRAALRRAR